MTCIHFNDSDFPGVLCVDPSDGPFLIEYRASRWWFEWSDRWGPLRVGKDGSTVEQPGWRSPFWRVATLWSRQGKRVQDGRALWSEPPIGTDYVRRLGKRSFLHVRSDYPEGFDEEFSELRTVELGDGET